MAKKKPIKKPQDRTHSTELNKLTRRRAVNNRDCMAPGSEDAFTYRDELRPPLEQKRWGVMTSDSVVTGLDHRRAWRMAEWLNARGRHHATVITADVSFRFFRSLGYPQQLSEIMQKALIETGF
jgi:hypothetical protein